MDLPRSAPWERRIDAHGRVINRFEVSAHRFVHPSPHLRGALGRTALAASSQRRAISRHEFIQLEWTSASQLRRVHVFSKLLSRP